MDEVAYMETNPYKLWNVEPSFNHPQKDIIKINPCVIENMAP